VEVLLSQTARSDHRDIQHWAKTRRLGWAATGPWPDCVSLRARRMHAVPE